MDNFLITANQNLAWGDGVEIRMGKHMHDRLAVAQPVSFETIEHGAYVQPFLRLDRPTAQKLFDELWNNGYRPAQSADNSGALDATVRHLEDMRTLVFAKQTLETK